MPHKQLVEDAAKQIGLKWAMVVMDKRELDAPRCVSHLNQGHEVWIDEYTAKDLKDRATLLRHEVSHLWLAENIDTCFSCLRFEKEPSQKDAVHIYMSWCGVDVWVDRIRHGYWPGDIREEVRITIKEADRLANAKPNLFLEQPSLLFSMAVTKAEIDYYGLSFDLRPVIRKLPPAAHDKIKKLDRIFRELPVLFHLTEEHKASAVHALSDMMSKVAIVMNYPVWFGSQKFAPGEHRWTVNRMGGGFD